MKLKTQALVLLVLAAVFAGGLATGYGLAPKPSEVEQGDEIWTCSMDPQVRQPGPGKCPICGMALTKLEGSSGDRSMQMSEAGRKLAEIVTAPVERRFVSKEIRLVGKVSFDETR
ncbi:MAG: heavy metal-binding domain-containing protein, partial [Planctomycetota bacterium]